MDIISERITNISDYENKVQAARSLCSMLERIIQTEKYEKAEYLAKKLSLELHELADFEFVLEARKVTVPAVHG